MDAVPGKDAGREIDGSQNEKEDPGEHDEVYREGGEPRGEPRVAPLQAFTGGGRGLEGPDLARGRGHGAATARSPAGGPGGPG